LGSPRPDDPDNPVRRRIASSYAWTIS
jgi:hypothetical protein